MVACQRFTPLVTFLSGHLFSVLSHVLCFLCFELIWKKRFTKSFAQWNNVKSFGNVGKYNIYGANLALTTLTKEMQTMEMEIMQRRIT